MRQVTKTRIFLLLLAIVAGSSAFMAYRAYRAPLPAAPDVQTRVSGGIVAGGIPAIDEPSFVRPLVADQYLKNEGLGLDVEVDGKHRFYPYQILVWHEAVNDVFGEQLLLVTFGPLSYLGIVYERTVNGSETFFEVTPRLEDSNTLLKDRETGSLWKQATGMAIEGELTGVQLAAYPSHVMAWADWKDAYPQGEVLSIETGFERDYTRDPYATYYSTDAIWFPLSREDIRLRLKDLVWGIVDNENAKAYPAAIVASQKTIDDTLGDISIRIVNDEEAGVVRAYRLDGTELGEELPILFSFWFAWSTAYPETELYLP